MGALKELYHGDPNVIPGLLIDVMLPNVSEESSDDEQEQGDDENSPDDKEKT